MGIFEGFAGIAAATIAINTTTAIHIITTDTPKPKRRSRWSPKFRRPALVSPISSININVWDQLLTCRTDEDFLISVNLTRSLFLYTLLLPFELERAHCNFHSPFRKKPKSSGHNAHLQSSVLLGLSLWFLETKSAMYELCPLFGIVLSIVSVWFDFSMEVLHSGFSGVLQQHSLWRYFPCIQRYPFLSA